ncbi:MAG TPA: hypothetical protein V6D22_22210 [Candidatus Obscuribacterales bacterium]
MSELGNGHLSPPEYKFHAEKLCEQGRLVESRWRRLQIEREHLSRQADQLKEVAARLATFIRLTHDGMDERAAELLAVINNLPLDSERLTAAEESVVASNVRQLSEYIEDQRKQLQAESEARSTVARVSMKVLCQQARYIVVYLDRAIQTNDVSCLPRLAEDLTRISAVLYSTKIKTICEQFVRATATQNWSAIKILQKALDEELSTMTEGVDSPVNFLKAG